MLVFVSKGLLLCDTGSSVIVAIPGNIPFVLHPRFRDKLRQILITRSARTFKITKFFSEVLSLIFFQKVHPEYLTWSKNHLSVIWFFKVSYFHMYLHVEQVQQI